MNRFLPAVLICLLASAGPAASQTVAGAGDNKVLTHRQQAVLIRGFIEKRFDTLLPRLMREAGIDMWVIVSREYNDDPVFRSMAPMTTYSSRRRTILIFVDPGAGKPVERLSIGRFDYDGLFKVVPTHNDAQWEGLRKLVAERNLSFGNRLRYHARIGRQTQEEAQALCQQLRAAGGVCLVMKN